ncbi:hypothetical protein BS47DRAFT_1351005 [Hydnum rufescens UP504]|uniref:Uncharacterized protein n=1 Tax=Hydnum rufescens UP504 TaxID=1448309 RepID=A0A9P6ALV9_9AGAM|nr:hypothetical protein BS47DRAFT_1351005 [Hydnum rufescens UP504]
MVIEPEGEYLVSNSTHARLHMMVSDPKSVESFTHRHHHTLQTRPIKLGDFI